MCLGTNSTDHWDPMKEDYLSIRNKYSVDDEDVGCALHSCSKGMMCITSFIQSVCVCGVGEYKTIY